MTHQDPLIDVGFTANEAALYRTLLGLGEATPALVAKRSKMPRTYVYDLLRALEAKGYAISTDTNGKRQVSAVRPNRIKRAVTEKLQAFETLLPELESLYQDAPNKPTVRYFEGKDGLEAIHDEVLAEAKELRFFGTTTDWIEHFDDWYEFSKSFVDHKIKVLDLVARTPEIEKVGTLYAGTPSEMRFARAEWQFGSNFAIWGNKVALLVYANEMHGIIIESPAIVKSLQTIHTVFWELAEKPKPTA